MKYVPSLRLRCCLGWSLRFLLPLVASCSTFCLSPSELHLFPPSHLFNAISHCPRSIFSYTISALRINRTMTKFSIRYEGIVPRSLIRSYFEEKSTEAKIVIIESISDYFKEVKFSINRVTFIIPKLDKAVKYLVKCNTRNNTSTITVYRPRFQTYSPVRSKRWNLTWVSPS